MQFRLGDKVKVVIPPGDVTGTDVIKTYHKGTSTLGRTVILAGCRSDWGINYEFLEEWLMLADEGVEE